MVELNRHAEERRDKEDGQADAIAALANLVAGRRPGVYLWGETGRGKSWLADRAVMAAWDRGIPSLCIREREFLQAATGAARGDGGWCDQLIAAARSVSLLCLDEFGRTRRITEVQQDALDQLVDDRMDPRLRTIVVTNIDREHLAADTCRGATLASRIVGLCGPPVFIDGPDWRHG